MNEGQWPGEERLTSTEEEELGPEVAPDDVDVAPGEEELAEAEAEAAPPEEQVDGSSDGDTPLPVEEETAAAS